jgi:transposase
VPRPHPKEFRADVVAVARRGDAPIGQIAKDFGISESCLRNWLRAADVEDGDRPGATASESAELRELRRQHPVVDQPVGQLPDGIRDDLHRRCVTEDTIRRTGQGADVRPVDRRQVDQTGNRRVVEPGLHLRPIRNVDLPSGFEALDVVDVDRLRFHLPFRPGRAATSGRRSSPGERPARSPGSPCPGPG